MPNPINGQNIQFRRPKYNSSGGIDCEILHPDHGWIPFTADENDTVEHGRQIHARLKALPPQAIKAFDGDNGPANA